MAAAAWWMLTRGGTSISAEQAAFLDGLDHFAQRRAGTEELL